MCYKSNFLFQPFWRAAGKSGEVVTNGGASTMLGCDGGPLCIVYDATSHNGNAAIVGFIGASQAVQWRQKEVSRLYNNSLCLSWFQIRFQCAFMK